MRKQQFKLERIEDCISFLLGKAYQQVTQDAKRRLNAHGVTPAQYAVLKVLWEGKPMTASAIGARLVLDSATMTGVIDRLERSGLAERKSDAKDRRVHRLTLTPKGRALEGPLDREMEAMNRSFLADLTPTDSVRLKKLLATLAEPPTVEEER